MAAALGLLLLAACGQVGGGAPGSDAPAGAPPATAETVAGLALTRWAPPGAGAPRAVAVALHGYGDYAETIWPDAARDWAARGIEVWAYDQRGFGRNPSHRDWPGAEALIADFAEVLAEVRAARPGLPVFAVGHSMGGGVALAALGEGRARPDGLVLMAPAVWGGDSLSPLLRAAAWGAAQLFPDTRFSRADSPVRLLPTDNMERLVEISRDPLRFADPSPREFMGLIRLMDRAVAAAPEAEAPMLVMVGAHDEIIPERSVRRVYEALPGPKRYARMPEGWHMLPIDRAREAAIDRAGDWMLERAAEAAPETERGAG